MVEVIREIGRGKQTLFVLHMNSQHSTTRDYPMMVKIYNDHPDDFQKVLTRAVDGNDRGYKVDLVIHCHDAETLRDRILLEWGIKAKEGRRSEWAITRPEKIISAWINLDMPQDLSPARQLAYARRMLGVTQTELGQRLGLSLNSIQSVENGKNPGSETLQRYAKALGLRYRITH